MAKPLHHHDSILQVGTHAHHLDDQTVSDDPRPNPLAKASSPTQHSGCRIRSYTQLSNKLGADKFTNVLQHVLVGNQVVVRGEDQQLVGSILWLLKVRAFASFVQNHV